LPSIIRPPDRTVVIVRKPVEGDIGLLVREAKYTDPRPKPCTGDGDSATCFYTWYGPEFEAYPPLGLKPIAYDGDENTAAATTPPKLTTKFYRCHREHDTWLLDAPPASGGGNDVCLVHGPLAGTQWLVTPDPDFIRVVHMKKNPAYTTGSGLPTHIVNEPTGNSVVACWPGTKQSFWRHYASTNQGFPPLPLSNAVYLETAMIGGVEYVTPVVAIATDTPNPALPAGDC
jgi:hypothetical protein